MCACSMGLIISRPCRQNRWCQFCVRGWLPNWDHNRSSWNNPVELSLTGLFHDGLVRRTNDRYLRFICRYPAFLHNLFPQRLPGLENQTQQETPLLDKVCGEVTVTDPTHPLYGQTLPQLPVRINRSTPHVMVLLPIGIRS